MSGWEVSNAMPEWASQLVIQVCADYGKPVPVVRWSNSRARKMCRWSSGRAWSHQKPSTNHRWQVSICAGNVESDVRIVLLHELAHWLAPDAWHHNYGFWQLAWELFGRYGCDYDECMEREGAYRKKGKEVGAAADRIPFYEAIQVIAMCVRYLETGDRYRAALAEEDHG